jgi:glycosyltransferase involved in cell wall biosynthesis
MKISIITATFNSEKTIQKLIDSLRLQSFKEFEWIVVDGESKDNTLEILNKITDLNLHICSRSDFGVYDAINRGIRLSKCDYYIVIGSDDHFEVDAIENFAKEIDGLSSVITAPFVCNKNIVRLSKFPRWISGYRSNIYGHSVATLFRKNLHKKYGFYSNSYPIAADYEFMMKLIINNENIKICNFVAGEFSLGGLSSENFIGASTEVMRIMFSIGFSKPIQILILIFRIGYKSLREALKSSHK